MASDKGKLTPEQRAIVRRRWEGFHAEGFDWLAREASAAFGLTISRQALAKAAAKGGWAKGGEPSQPLAAVAQRADEVAVVAQPKRLVAQPKGSEAEPERVVAEPVDLPDGVKPEGYAGTGRPAKYRVEYDTKIIEFFNVTPTEHVEVAGFGGATKMQVIARLPPTLVRFAQEIGVSVDTVGRWATETNEDGRPRYPSFAEAYARARQLLESLMVEGAAVGVYDSKVTQFILKNWYGWRDQPEKDVAVTPVSSELLDTLYIQRMTAARERQRLVLEERARLRNEEQQGSAS